MKHIQKKEILIRQTPLTDRIFKEDSIFFDIETTGFSPASSIVYLIGCLRKDKDSIIIDQFLAENKADEKDVILSFLELIKDKNTIISFHGVGFDIPFIQAKCNAYNIPETLKEYQYVDIFKIISGIKFLLKLPNYKQKTIETFLNLKRDDIFSGGELINVYEEYLHTHSEESEKLLLLHNFEDVMGMLNILPVLTYTEILNGNYTVKDVSIQPYSSYDGESGQEMILTLENAYSVPNRISVHCNDFYLTMNKDISKIRVPIYEGELKFFYSNYKDYFYLPKEDVAMHKSVASFVDKEYRQKAKAATCYTRKNGLFLPQYDTFMSPVFRKEYKDKLSYFEYTEDFISSDEMLGRYADHIIQYMLSAKGK